MARLVHLDADPSGADEREVTLATGLTLSYAARGDENGPVVVLLPGPTDSWRSYGPVLAHVPASLRVIALSQRGHGDSDKPPDGYSVGTLADDLALVFDALRIERAVVAAHSGSCLVARRFALDAPDRAAGLVLEASPTTLRGNPDLRDFVESTVSCLEDPIDPAFARSFLSDTASTAVPYSLLDALVGELLKVPAFVWKEVFADLLGYDDEAELGNIAAPALLIWGDADRLVPRSMQLTLLQRLEEAQLIEYRGVGHTPRWEHPARFAEDLTRFVERAVQV